MIHYIGKQSLSNLGWKKYLLIGGASLALIAGAVKGVFSCSRADEPAPVNIESVEGRVDSVLAELRNNPDVLNQNYDKLATVVEQGLAEHPDYANRFVRSSLESLERSEDIEKDTYLAMFQRIRDKAEEKPELMDHFGENAKAYMEKKIVDDYTTIIEESFKESASNLREKSKPLLQALGMAKDYVLEKIREE